MEATLALNQKHKQLEMAKSKLNAFSVELMEKNKQLQQLILELENMERNYSEVHLL